MRPGRPRPLSQIWPAPGVAARAGRPIEDSWYLRGGASSRASHIHSRPLGLPVQGSHRLGLVLALAPLPQDSADWATFVEDPSRLSVAVELGAQDAAEKDYAWGDLDQDGWVDLVVVRKEPFSTTGLRQNLLLMNEGGTLVDRTALYASASSLAGDLGFLTPTNDRDVVLVDVDQDGWLDIVTSTTLGPGLPKELSHPRVYRNLGLDGAQAWQGLVHEPDRIPDLGTFPNFCGVAAGDVTGDGFPDLYFAHYDESAAVDLDDRLLVNDGSGSFLDESTTRLPDFMRESAFGTAAVIADVNGDGHLDVVKNSGVGSSSSGSTLGTMVLYNNPSQPGHFNLFQEAWSMSPYHVNVGDLNRDDRPDLVITDDGADRYLLNEGNDAIGRVIWNDLTFQGVDEGLGGNNLVADLDGDGWNDVLIADVDADIPGCERRLHLYHSRGGAVGGPVTLAEEVDASSVGAAGLTPDDLVGTHDVAVFDLDGDGDLDMVLGRCDSTNVWLNRTTDSACVLRYCGYEQSPSNNSTIGIGTCDSSASSIPVRLHGGPAGQFVYLVVGDGSSTVSQPPGAAGDLCVAGGACLGRYTGDLGQISAAGQFSTDIQNPISNPCGGAVVIAPGVTWNFQYWHRRPLGQLSTFSQALSVTFH